jgi:hypothetical protein
MKFFAATTTALALATTSFSTAFVPAVKNPSSFNNGLKMSAVETPVYTFKKSEEVFKEALEVSIFSNHYRRC